MSTQERHLVLIVFAIAAFGLGAAAMIALAFGGCGVL
jgi:hypothetical protein